MKTQKKVIDFSGNGFSMVATENEENTKYFNRYIKDIELLSVVNILEDYLRMLCVYVCIIAFSQFNSVKIKIKRQIQFFNIFLILDDI